MPKELTFPALRKVLSPEDMESLVSTFRAILEKIEVASIEELDRILDAHATKLLENTATIEEMKTQMGDLKDRVTDLEQPQPEPLPEKRVKSFLFHTAPAPSSDDERSVHDLFAQLFGVHFSQRWESHAERFRWWAEANPAFRLGLWLNMMCEGGRLESMTGTGEILHDAGGAMIKVRGYENSFAEGISDIRLFHVQKAKLASLQAIIEEIKGIFTHILFDNVSIHPLSPLSGSGVWTGTPNGMTDEAWDLAAGQFIDAACELLPEPDSILAGNIGHWILDLGYAGLRDNDPDPWAAEWVNARHARFRPVLEHWPQLDAGFGLVHSLKVTSLFNRHVFVNVEVPPGGYDDQRLMDFIWGAFLSVCKPGSWLDISPFIGDGGYHDRASALADLLRYRQEIAPRYEQLAENLGELQHISWPPLGSYERDVTAVFDNGAIMINARNSDGLAECTLPGLA